MAAFSIKRLLFSVCRFASLSHFYRNISKKATQPLRSFWPQIEHQQHMILSEAKLVDWLELWHLNSEVGGTIPGRGKEITFQN